MDTDLGPTDDLAEVERRLAAMPLVDAMTTQRAVRRVRPDPVDLRIVRRCIELALEGPTGSNGQNWEFVVVTERAAKERFQVQYRRAWSLYGRAGERVRGGDPQTAKILRSVQWQVDHLPEIPVLVVACLRGGGKVPVRADAGRRRQLPLRVDLPQRAEPAAGGTGGRARRLARHAAPVVDDRRPPHPRPAPQRRAVLHGPARAGRSGGTGPRPASRSTRSIHLERYGTAPAAE